MSSYLRSTRKINRFPGFYWDMIMPLMWRDKVQLCQAILFLRYTTNLIDTPHTRCWLSCNATTDAPWWQKWISAFPHIVKTVYLFIHILFIIKLTSTASTDYFIQWNVFTLFHYLLKVCWSTIKLQTTASLVFPRVKPFPLRTMSKDSVESK